ncbi:hypothetical protein BaRGS_00027686 [Batillaria attramentaria]|uniref:Glycosyl hydrolase family 13 catalytic domain-containing protein n=1 Tax=Batillaria attramentaria TaxID=370345 RepID=A0ABD0K262_9CAEN
MDSPGILLTSFSKSSPETPSPQGAPPAYDNMGFEPGTPAADAAPSGSNTSISSNDIDDATAANTYANSAMFSEKLNNVGDGTTATTTAATADTTTTTTTNGGGLPGSMAQNSPVPPTRHKDSTVGFRLPQSHERKSSSAGLKDDQPFRGMGKEELLRHSSKPFWRRLRYICMTVVLVGWLALIITVVALVLVYPRCRSPVEQDWWQKGVVYRLYVRSFQDRDGDGVGDLQGVRSRLDYLQELGVSILSLSPIYLAPDSSTSDWDILDHTKISPLYGNMEDFAKLVNESHAKGMHVVLDFIPNLTSNKHEWFNASRNSSSTDNPKRNYYVWGSGLGYNQRFTPSNWISVYGGSAWKLALDRNQYYLHQRASDQPELNLRSQEIKDELQNILQFWLDQGVDGFYIRDSGYLFEDYDLRDEALLPNATDEDAYESYNHTYTYGQSEIYDMFARWRAYLDDYGNKTNKYILLFADRRGTTEEVMRYYGHFNRDGVDFPLNVLCLEQDESTDGRGVSRMVREWMGHLPPGRWLNWLSGTDSSPRLIDRMGEKLVRPFLTLIMLMPGTPFILYGDEIGMSALPLGVNETEQDEGQRNLSMRSPMQWDPRVFSGFTAATKEREPWLRINNDYKHGVNVETQRAAEDSIYHLFTNLTSLRREYSAFHYGDYNEAVVDDHVFSFVRDYDGIKGFLVALNFANETVSRSFRGAYETIPSQGSVALVTGTDVSYTKGDKISTSGVTLGPYQGVVLSWDYVAKEL